MQGTVTVLKVDGTVVSTTYDKPVPLEDLQAAVGGWIEIVPDFDTFGDLKGVVAFVNEEGKLKGLPENTAGTEAWAKSVGAEVADLGDYLSGDVAIVSGDDAFMSAL